MSQTRFTQSMVLACIAFVAACTSTGTDEGPVGNTQIKVVIPDAEGTDVQSVEYTIRCLGNDDRFLDNQQRFPDGVIINGNLEVTEPESGDPADAQIREGFMDLPPGACTLDLRARDNDGEVICTAQEPFNVVADSTTTVPITLICGLSFQAPVGQLDIQGDFSYNVANFCPDIFALNCLESFPTAPEGELAKTRCEVRSRDGDKQCGDSCDPQTCEVRPNESGLICTPGDDPSSDPGNVSGLTTVVTCEGGSIDCNGDEVDDGSCTFDGDQLGTLFANTAPNQVVPNPATFEVLCDGQPGATVTCTAAVTDGDADCDKTKEVSFTCPGLTPCGQFGDDNGQTPDQAGGDAACEALAATVCTVDTCNNDTCDGTEANCCVNTPVPNTPPTDCSAEIPPLAECVDGVCAPSACTGDPDCDDLEPCTVDTCNVGTGVCTNAPVAEDTPCTNLPGVDDGFCSAAGVCTQVTCRTATEDTDCTDGNPCTTDTCDETVVGNACVNTDVADGTACSPPTGGACFAVGGNPSECFASECQDPADCTDTTPCAPTAVCDTSVNPGGICVYEPADAGDACPTPGADPATCQSGVCGECDGAGTCNEKPLTCDTVFRDVVTCQTRELLALDCFLLGSAAPLIIDPTVTPADVAFAGVPVNIDTQLVLNLPASLVCGFATVVPLADVYQSVANLDLLGATPSPIALDSFLGSFGHGPVTFDFAEGCGNQAGACVNGFCNGGTVECTTLTEVVDCAGSGPGVVVPFLSTTAPDSIEAAAPGVVSVQYGYEDIGAFIRVPALFANLCLGEIAVNTPQPLPGPPDGPGGFCGFICEAQDRTGDGATGDPNDSPRVVTDSECDKIGIAACGGTPCPNGLDAECPLAAAGQTCDTAAGLCRNVNAGYCVGATAGTCDNPPGQACATDADCAPPTAALLAGGTCSGASPGVCPDTTTPCGVDRDCIGVQADLGVPVCCEEIPLGQAFFDFSQAGNVCATGEPGSALAETEAPCTGNEDPRSLRGRDCRGQATCGSCQQVTGPAPLSVFNPQQDWPIVEFCSAIDGNNNGRCAGSNTPCPNGDIDCRNADGSGIGTAGEDYCIVPCASCDQVSCCNYISTRFPTTTGPEFPIIPVNPAP